MSDSENRKKGGAPAGEEELASKLITVGYKRFYIDVKQNSRGRFIKIAEMNANHKSRVVLSMSASALLVERLAEYLEIIENTPEDPNRDEAADIKSDTLLFDTRRYYLDLKENSRGRFLRIAQTMTLPRPSRSQVAIPSDGLKDMKEIIADFVATYGEGYMEANETENSKQLKADLNKTFYFDVQSNDRGQFVRISEVKVSSGFRTSITVPAPSLIAFRNSLTEVCEKLNLDKTDLEA